MKRQLEKGDQGILVKVPAGCDESKRCRSLLRGLHAHALFCGIGAGAEAFAPQRAGPSGFVLEETGAGAGTGTGTEEADAGAPAGREEIGFAA